MSKKKRIPKAYINGGTIPPPAVPTTSPGVVFSFKYFSTTPQKFGFHKCEVGYVETLVNRLRDISRAPWKDMATNNSNAIRSHQINFSETSEPDGFAHLPEHLRDNILPWQFSLSANKHGRVHGFVISEVFFVVWIDPAHQLYAGK